MKTNTTVWLFHLFTVHFWDLDLAWRHNKLYQTLTTQRFEEVKLNC